jgi:ketosteroid isomerase-like protein
MFATPQEAEEAFYQAFTRTDLDAMMAVWDDNDAIECIHPRGERLRGTAAVEESWRQIFSASPRVRIGIEEQTYTQSSNLAVHVVTEIIDVEDPDSRTARVVATNVFQLTRSGWRLILHHGSPATAPARPRSDSGKTKLH